MFYYFKKFCKEKIYFSSVDANTKMSMSRFINGLKMCRINEQSQQCGTEVKKKWQILIETKFSLRENI